MKKHLVFIALLLAASAEAIEVEDGIVFETEGTDTFFIAGGDFSWENIEVGDTYIVIDDSTLSFTPEGGGENVTIEELGVGNGSLNLTTTAGGELEIGFCGYAVGGNYSIESGGELLGSGVANSSGCFTYMSNVSGATSLDVSPPAQVVSLSEVLDAVNDWVAGLIDLSYLIELITSWATTSL